MIACQPWKTPQKPERPRADKEASHMTAPAPEHDLRDLIESCRDAASQSEQVATGIWTEDEATAMLLAEHILASDPNAATAACYALAERLAGHDPEQA
jgi:hypothetical protein